MKIKKWKGGFRPFLTEDESMISTTSSRNTVYVYNADNGKLLHTVKTVSNVSETAVSGDGKLLAAKNTSGTISVICLETQEEICRSAMEGREGYAMLFMPDHRTLLDFDWEGRTMRLDCITGRHDILDGPGAGVKSLPKLTSHIQYDAFSNQICKLCYNGSGLPGGRVMVSPACADQIAFRTVHEFETALPRASDGLSFCRTNNYYLDRRQNQLVAADKSFTELFRKELPAPGICSVDKIWVSKDEKYLFMDFGRQCDSRDFAAYKTAKSLSCLFALDTMEQIAEFDYDYVSDFLTFDGDRKFLLATWHGSYMGVL